jgi:hypothetical protein
VNPVPDLNKATALAATGHRLMQLADGLTFLPPETRQKTREQTGTNAHEYRREALNLLSFSDRLLRS